MSDYEKLKSIIDEIDILISQNVTSSAPTFQAWKAKAERFLISYYGNSSYEVKKFREERFSLIMFAGGTPESAFVKACASGLKTTKAILQTYLQEMADDADVVSNQMKQNNDFSKIFIVHGHDSELKLAVARLIEKQGIEAVILREQANRGKTIIEKIEEYSDVGAAICLFTADDFGRAKKDNDDKSRARQNVVFEAGYFMGKLGRDKLVILSENGVELPSDMQGVVYCDKTAWEFQILKELKAIGYNIDYNKLD